MKTNKSRKGTFLVCDECGYACFVHPVMASRIAQSPPACPGCGRTTRTSRHDPARRKAS